MALADEGWLWYELGAEVAGYRTSVSAGRPALNRPELLAGIGKGPWSLSLWWLSLLWRSVWRGIWIPSLLICKGAQERVDHKTASWKDLEVNGRRVVAA